jgi:hypothetical protein
LPGVYLTAIKTKEASILTLQLFRSIEKGQAPAQPVNKLLVNRPWLDKIPQTDREKFRLYVFEDDIDGQIGGHVQFESMYKLQIELFTFAVKGSELAVLWMHDQTTTKTQCRIDKIPKATDGLDLKLTIQTDPRNRNASSVFYSSTEWGNVTGLCDVVSISDSMCAYLANCFEQVASLKA